MSPNRISLRGGYKTDETQRLLAKLRRDELKAKGLCISSATHGPATDGVLCARCREQHRRSA